MAAQVAGYRAEGYRRFQLKVGGDPDDGHRAHPRRRRASCSRATASSPTPTPAGCMHEAMRVVRAVRDVDVYIEQPCLTLRGVPGGPPAHRPPVRARRDHRRPRRAAARPRRPGDGRGQPQDQQARRPDARRGRPATCASSLGIAMTLEDSWGGDIVTAAIAHLAHSTPPEFLFTATDFNSYVTRSIAAVRRSASAAVWRRAPPRVSASRPTKPRWGHRPSRFDLQEAAHRPRRGSTDHDGAVMIGWAAAHTRDQQN